MSPFMSQGLEEKEEEEERSNSSRGEGARDGGGWEGLGIESHMRQPHDGLVPLLASGATWA